MIGIFKQKNPGNALLLLIYALVLKFSMFLHPAVPILHSEDNYLYRVILNALGSVFHQSAILFSVLTFLILFSQATLFNRVCNHHKLLPRANFLPGMAYILITSLLPDWNHFSAPLLINSIMIWIWYQMIDLYSAHRPGALIFNIGVWTGVVSLLYVPAMAFILLVLFGLLTMRPFRVREWLVGLLGFTSPYYFLFLVLYLTGHWNWHNMLPHIVFTLPGMPSSIWVTLGIALLVIPFIVGGYFVQNNLNKVLIQIRKSWSLLLLFLMVAIVIILINRANSYENWIVTAVPFAAFHSAAYYYPARKTGPLILHWIIVLYIIAVNYNFV
ncbi:MAG: DUF6427 family protein [Bacteroidota bacterium]|nr:DUF6427 family protein [Bacteroidota bacterium]MDP4216599.1 DUF6427 family protein [Bacteroidota bacterium]MDP4245867.1 DUF6427 family protein [Bacteroidota bacterium]MDP4256607.1 DUF6427 family protein [Bacteroidota bacterium]